MSPGGSLGYPKVAFAWIEAPANEAFCRLGASRLLAHCRWMAKDRGIGPLPCLPSHRLMLRVA
jgi:hypothetical protein